MKDLISIIAPAYNHEKYIEKCIYSIAGQSYANKELIIIDDNSTDKTQEIIEKIIKRKDIKAKFKNRIKFIKHATNQGAHYSINEGISLSKGHYVTIINTDDLYEKNRLEVMIEELMKKDGHICFSKVDTIDENGKVLRNEEWEYYSYIQNKIERYPSINLSLLTDNVAISTGNMLFTRELYDKIGPFKDYKYIHDWDFILRTILITEPIYVNKTNYLYRLHPTNSFKELKKDNDLCYKESYEVLSNFCRNIKQGNYNNKHIQNKAVWEYFIKNIIKNPDIAHIWRLSDAS